MNDRIHLITGNVGKAAEFERLMGVRVSPTKLELDEVQAIDLETVAVKKATDAFSRLNEPVFVDDSGIVFNSWNGLPGALTSWFLDSVGNDGLLRMLASFEDRGATAVTVLAYCDEDGVRTFRGSVSGSIARAEMGSNGFGYDAIFIPGAARLTFAEMSNEEKDLYSMRAIAAGRLREFLRSRS